LDYVFREGEASFGERETPMLQAVVPRVPVFAALAAAALCLGLSGCKRETEINQREDRPINLQAENLGASMKIIRKDPFPWHNVTFVLDKKYEYTQELVDQPEFEIPYDSFRDASGEPYDPSGGPPGRLRVFADEGRWPHWGAHN